MEDELNASIQRLEEESVTTMSTLGLTVNTISPAQEEIWYRETKQGIESQIGATFDKTIYDQMMRILNEYRSRQ
jgi:hypothetical protein